MMLPPLWRRHSCQEHPYDGRRLSTAHGLPLEQLEPRTHIRIKQRFHSDTERYLCRNRTLEKLRPGLKKPRLSWPSSLKRYPPSSVVKSAFVVQHRVWRGKSKT
ncbi:hypothetical protein F2P81_005495 [Scophthalmus maximus]|uniref:Uncharacterized protein n=1 Tax=Scophthalmus maximus TaxID=52904 RepID=A0A6A4T7E5_SCOMX|nr:hypothetical protein F2P81_005495 [Scophthalmus maximus]